MAFRAFIRFLGFFTVMLMIPIIQRPFQSIFVALLFFLASPGLLDTAEATESSLTTGTNLVTTNAIPTAQNAEDQFRLGRAYFRGEGVQQSYEQAGLWYRKSADQGNLKAMHNLGILFLQGLGTPKDEAEGYRWIRMAAEKGDPLSISLCGILLCDGRGVAKNAPEGLIWLHKAAEAGDANALARLGQDAYFGDDGVPKDHQAALVLIRAAAEKGNPWACDTLGHFYFRGELVPQDKKKASEWLAKGPHAAAGVD